MEDIEKKDYEFSHVYMGDEDVMCDAVMLGAHETIPLCDNIAQTVHNITLEFIGEKKLFDVAYQAKDDIDEFIQNGFKGLDYDKYNITNIIMLGICVHYQKCLMENLDNIVYNYLVNVFNTEYSDNDYDEFQEEDVYDWLEIISRDVDSSKPLIVFKNKFLDWMKEIDN